LTGWLLDVPSYLLRLLTNFLNLWETNDFVGALDTLEH